MRKFVFTAIAISAIVFTGCNQKSNSDNHKTLQPILSSVDPGYIRSDSANKMIRSYLKSLDSLPIADTPMLKSLIIDAGSLRDYLSDTSIKSVKLMFAHTLSYINLGHEGKPGYNSDALTVVIAGYDGNGNYVLKDDSLALDHARPCPRNCPSSGTASFDLLP